MRSCNPAVQARRFRLFRFRSPLLSESLLIYFPPGTEMVHFPGLARTRLYIQRAVSRVHRDGFPHSEIPGSKPACGSPGLIAASHVLLRLLAPRHPPYALSSLTIKLTQHVASAQLARRTSCSADNSPFHNLLYSSRTCGLNAAHIPSALRRAQMCVALLPAYSVVKELRSWSWPRAPRSWRGVRKLRTENKKPGVERRANSSTH